MGLGNNRDYKTTERRTMRRLAEHYAIMKRLIVEGVEREEASKQAMAQLRKAPPVRTLGRVVIERDGPGYTYMLPDGRTGAGPREAVERTIKAWAKRKTKAGELSGLVIAWPEEN